MNTPHKPLVTACLALVAWLSFFAGPSSAAGPFPYELDAGTDAAVVFGTGVVYGLTWWLDRDFRPFTQEEARGMDRSGIPALDRYASRRWSPSLARTSDVLYTGQMVLPLALIAGDSGSRRPWPLAVMHLETVLLTRGVTHVFKNAFDRTRPFVFNEDAAVPLEMKTSHMARKSFPSGHTSHAFATMVYLGTVFGELHPDSPHRDLVWGLCLGTATATGALRVASGRHFPSDVVAGAALGALVGWAIPRWHEIDHDGSDPAASKSRPSFSIGWSVGF